VRSGFGSAVWKTIADAIAERLPERCADHEALRRRREMPRELAVRVFPAIGRERSSRAGKLRQ
jgi:hypothetical protein